MLGGGGAGWIREEVVRSAVQWNEVGRSGVDGRMAVGEDVGQWCC